MGGAFLGDWLAGALLGFFAIKALLVEGVFAWMHACPFYGSFRVGDGSVGGSCKLPFTV